MTLRKVECPRCRCSEYFMKAPEKTVDWNNLGQGAPVCTNCKESPLKINTDGMLNVPCNRCRNEKFIGKSLDGSRIIDGVLICTKCGNDIFNQCQEKESEKILKGERNNKEAQLFR